MTRSNEKSLEVVGHGMNNTWNVGTEQKIVNLFGLRCCMGSGSDTDKKTTEEGQNIIEMVC